LHSYTRDEHSPVLTARRRSQDTATQGRDVAQMALSPSCLRIFHGVKLSLGWAHCLRPGCLKRAAARTGRSSRMWLERLRVEWSNSRHSSLAILHSPLHRLARLTPGVDSTAIWDGQTALSAAFWREPMAPFPLQYLAQKVAVDRFHSSSRDGGFACATRKITRFQPQSHEQPGLPLPHRAVINGSPCSSWGGRGLLSFDAPHRTCKPLIHSSLSLMTPML